MAISLFMASCRLLLCRCYPSNLFVCSAFSDWALLSGACRWWCRLLWQLQWSLQTASLSCSPFFIWWQVEIWILSCPLMWTFIRYRGVDGYRRARCDSGTGDTFRQVTGNQDGNIQPLPPQVRSRTRMRQQFIKRLETVNSLYECEQECLNERTFKCLSFNYM